LQQPIVTEKLAEEREDTGLTDQSNGDRAGILEEVNLAQNLPKPGEMEHTEKYQVLRLTKLQLECLKNFSYKYKKK
jgi:hypothetical protein